MKFRNVKITDFPLNLPPIYPLNILHNYMFIVLNQPGTSFNKPFISHKLSVGPGSSYPPLPADRRWLRSPSHLFRKWLIPLDSLPGESQSHRVQGSDLNLSTSGRSTLLSDPLVRSPSSNGISPPGSGSVDGSHPKDIHQSKGLHMPGPAGIQKQKPPGLLRDPGAV